MAPPGLALRPAADRKKGSPSQSMLGFPSVAHAVTRPSPADHLDALHAELLFLPEPRAAPRAASAATDRLLDGLLDLADAHGAFREALLDLRRHAAKAQAALRLLDAARLGSSVCAQPHAEKDLARLAASAHAAATRLPQHGSSFWSRDSILGREPNPVANAITIGVGFVVFQEIRQEHSLISYSVMTCLYVSFLVVLATTSSLLTATPDSLIEESGLCDTR